MIKDYVDSWPCEQCTESSRISAYSSQDVVDNDGQFYKVTFNIGGTPSFKRDDIGSYHFVQLVYLDSIDVGRVFWPIEVLDSCTSDLLEV